MRALVDLLKSLLIGGFLFLLPLGVIIVILEKLLSIARRLGHALQGWLQPGARSEAAVLGFAVLILILLALLAGIFVRTSAGKKVFGWFEKILLSKLPFYTMVRQFLPDAEAGRLGEYHRTPVVTVHLDDQILVGLLVETTAEGRKVVYLPGAPTALSGTVTIMDAERVKETGLKPAQFVAGLRRLGGGMAAMLATSAQAADADPARRGP